MAKKKVADKGTKVEESSQDTAASTTTAGASTTMAGASTTTIEVAAPQKTPQQITAEVGEALAKMGVKIQKPERSKVAPPEGWVKLPLDLRPFWSPMYSKQPLQGILLAQVKLEAEGFTVLVVRLTADTDAMSVTGEMITAKAGQEVVVPQLYAFGAIAALLARKDLYYQIFIGNPEQIEIGVDDAGKATKIWSFTIVANPQGIPRGQ